MSTGKALGGMVVIGAVVAGGLYAGDRWAEGRAEEYAVSVVSQNLPTAQSPVVDIKGFPFLTQLASGTLGEVTATAASATFDGVPVTDVAVDATGVLVRPPAGQSPSARRATIAATIPTGSLEKVLKDETGLTVQLAADGSTVAATGTVLGLPLTLDLVPRVDGGKLLVDPQKLTLGGREISASSLPAALRQTVSGIQVPVEGLPPGVTLSGAQVVPGGVRITADGTDVVVPTG